MTGVVVRMVRDRSELRRFADLPTGLYAGRAGYVPRGRGEEIRRLRRLDGASLLLAWRGADVVGRVAAFVDHRGGGCFGWLDADPSATAPLLEAAAAALREDGCDEMVGPLRWPRWDAPGALVDRFEDRPVWGTAWNPPELSAALDEVVALHSANQSGCELQSWLVRAGSAPEFNGDVTGPTPRRGGGLHAALSAALAAADEWSGSIRTSGERDELAARVRMFADRSLIAAGEGAAAVAVPDANEVLARLAGDLGPRGIASLMRAARQRDWRGARLIASGANDPAAETAAIRAIAVRDLVIGPWPSADRRRAEVVAALRAEPDRRWRIVRIATGRDRRVPV